MSATRRGNLAYVPGSGDKPVPVLEEIVLEANTCERGWAPIEGAAVQLVAPWRLIYCHDLELNQRWPVAIMGLENHGPRSRRSRWSMLNEVASFYEDPVQRVSHKLYRLSNLLTSEQVGALLGVRAETLSKWRHRHEDFPKPLLEGQPYIWDRREIWNWGRKTGRIKLGRHDRRIDPRSIKQT
jgi:hypothetical protein